MAVQIAAGTTAAISSDIVITVGNQVSLFIVPAAAGQVTGDCFAEVQYKNGSDYIPIGTVGIAGIKIASPGTYRVAKGASGISYGVASE